MTSLRNEILLHHINVFHTVYYDILNILDPYFLSFKNHHPVANFKNRTHSKSLSSFRMIFFLPHKFTILFKIFPTRTRIRYNRPQTLCFRAIVSSWRFYFYKPIDRIYRNISQLGFYHARNTGTIGIQRRLVDWVCRGRRYKRLVSGTLPSYVTPWTVSNVCLKDARTSTRFRPTVRASTLLHKGCASHGIDLTSYHYAMRPRCDHLRSLSRPGSLLSPS